MKHRIVATLSVSAAMLIPALASANNTWHTANTEIGYTTALDHADGGKTRAQVVNELATAKADSKQWFFTYRNLGKPGWAKQGTSRTRADALAEVETMTPAERERLAAIYTPG